MPYIIDKASKKGMKIFLNPSPIDLSIKEIDLNKADTIIINQTEGKSLSSFSDEAKILDYFRENFINLHVILTLGSRGGIYSYKDKEIRYQAYPTKVVDTTAAGDTFLGYYLANIAANKDIQSSLKFASLAAAITCSRKGAANSIPTKVEVENFMKDKNIIWKK